MPVFVIALLALAACVMLAVMLLLAMLVETHSAAKWPAPREMKRPNVERKRAA